MTIRVIKYKRYEYGAKGYNCEGNLLTLVYDIPYFPACGIFPPIHVINEVFSSGGGAGGMSPGTGWKPFTISEQEYNELVTAVRQTAISEIKPYSRYADIKYKFDNEFDHIHDRFEWAQLICNKHRQQWHEELRKAEKLR